MQRRADTTFKAASWNETPVGEDDARPKLTRASVEQTYSGDVEGSSQLEYVMTYLEDGSALFVGLERLHGTVLGRAGSFALEHRGVFAAGVARMTLRVVEGSGVDGLEGLSGGGEFESAHAESYSLQLDLELPG